MPSRHVQAARTGVTWWQTDLGEPGAPTRLMHKIKPEIVIHLAGEVRGERSIEAVDATLRANLMATVEILEAATRLASRRIVLSGSLLEEPTGTARAIPPSPYGASRWAASAYARMFHALFGTPMVILRPSFAYGPGQETTKLVPHVITKLLAGERPELGSSGERMIDFVYAPDVAEAYVAATAAPDVEGMTVDIGVGRLTSVRDVVETIVRLVGTARAAPAFGRVPVRPLEQQIDVDPEVAGKSSLLARTYTPRIEGVRREFAWYRGDAYAAPDATTR